MSIRSLVRSSRSWLGAWVAVASLSCNTPPPLELSDGGPDASISHLSQALMSDRDGDGIADSSDNCADVVNANQKNSNGVGPGDACELALVLNQGLLSRYALYGSHKQLVISPLPVLLTSHPDLLRISAKGPTHAVAGLNLLGHNELGVASPGEIAPNQIASISGDEVLSIALGKDDVLTGALARVVWLKVQGTANLSLTFFQGPTLVATTTGTSQPGQSTKRFDASAAFDRVEIRATSGSFTIRGNREAVMFALGATQASCPSGYARVGSECVDIDECSGLDRVCDALTTCTNTSGSFTCGACPSGYRGTGATGCSDIDECEEQSDSCSDLTTCSNTAGSYTCGACPEGYAGDGRTCTDINECATATDTCDPLVTCTNTEGSYTCGSCPAGYEGGGATGCTDIDECSGPNHACDALTTCSNMPGAFTCSACPAGYTGDGVAGCSDVDECAQGLHDCSPLATCGNTPGSFQCGDCPSGYRGDGRTCSDVNECSEHTDLCSALVACTNTQGSYTCGACPDGYTGDGQICTDIDECEANPCDTRTSCTNSEGSYACGACPAGYVGNGYAGCVDVDECMQELDDCSPLVTCANTDGSFQCGDCPAGYQGNGRSCTDVNECQQNSDECSNLVTCTNTTGSYTCGACPTGYAGNGYTCTDIDECANAPCDTLTTCTNSEGSYLCGACPAGYTGDGYTSCLDIDECAVDNGQCPDTHRCVNSVGSRSCETCEAAQIGVSTNCGLGACVSTGVTACSYGEVVNSCTPGTALDTDASCNGSDDDCNGAVDEDFVVLPTSCGAGACAATGALSCVNGATLNSCAPGAPAGSDASCNGVDDDCDGVADEEYATSSTSCGVGACAATGNLTCVAGAVSDSCHAGTATTSDATCNGVDDDCDGSVDEDFASAVTTCGIGACATVGATSCQSGTVVDTCVAGSAASNDATCDGVDNDCDGVKDENYVPVATTCGIAQCARTGTSACQNGQVVNTCAPGAPEATIDRTCNGQDDDCDGTTDEECIETSCTNAQDDDQDSATDCEDDDCSGASNCQPCQGQQLCGCVGKPACAPENCDNGVDDDGNGLGDCADVACCDRGAGFCPEFCGPAPVMYSPPHVPVALTADMATRLNPLLARQNVPVDVNGAPLAPLDAERAAAIEGNVFARTGTIMAGEIMQPLPGVKVSIVGHSEYGHTYSDPAGHFSFAANGGGDLTFRFEMPGFITSERTLVSDFNMGGVLERVVMLPRSRKLTTVQTDGTAGWQVVQGELEEDSDGQRKAIMVFEPGVRASVYECDVPGCTPTRVTSMGIRITEFTTGPTGDLNMPGPLPPSSMYTYAADISASDAVAEDGHLIQFPAKVDGTDAFIHREDGVTPGEAHLYVSNFLNFPEGFGIPVGFFDDDNAFWRPEDNGLVMRMVGVDPATGEAQLKCGTLATATVRTRASNGNVTLDCDSPAGIGLTLKSGELKQMTAVFQINDSFWRANMTHLSNRDLNAAGGVPADSRLPTVKPLDAGPTCKTPSPWGSSVDCQSQVLYQELPVTGTPYRLHFASDRVPGYLQSRRLQVPLRAYQHPDLQAISAGFSDDAIEGPGLLNKYQRWAKPLMFYQFRLRLGELPFGDAPAYGDWIWNGKDALGKAMIGRHDVSFLLSYAYFCSYGGAARFGSVGGSVVRPGRGSSSSGSGGGARITVPSPPCLARESLTVRRTVEAWDIAQTEQLGGWTLGSHHFLDHGTVLLGSGDRADASASDTLNHLSTLPLSPPADSDYDSDVTPDGKVFLLSFARGELATNKLYRFDPKAKTWTIVASGDCSRAFIPGEGVKLSTAVSSHYTSATGWKFCSMRAFGIGNNALYIASGDNNMDGVVQAGETLYSEIWKIPLTEDSQLGVPERIAGNGQTYFTPDFSNARAVSSIASLQGKKATQVPIGLTGDIAVSNQGVAYVIDAARLGIYQIDQSGVINHVAGSGTPLASQMGGSPGVAAVLVGSQRNPVTDLPAKNVNLVLQAFGNAAPRLALDQQNRVYILERPLNFRIHRMGVDGKISTVWQWSTGTSATTEPLERFAAPEAFTVTPQGDALLFADARYRHIRRVDLTPGLSTKASVVLGKDISEASPVPAPECGSLVDKAQYDVVLATPRTIALGPGGQTYFLERCAANNHRLIRARSEELDVQVPSGDGSEIYLFARDPLTRKTFHRETRDATTGGVIRRFCYSQEAPEGVRCANAAATTPGALLQEIWENGNPEDGELEPGSARITKIRRNGPSVTIQGPDGQETVLELDEHGYLETVTLAPDRFVEPAHFYPAVKYRANHDENGLLLSFEEPGSVHRYEYDRFGRIVTDDGGDGHKLTMEVSEEAPGQRTVVKTTPQGITTTYRRLRDGDNITSTTTHADGTIDTLTGPVDGSRTELLLRDGTKIEQRYADDPALGSAVKYVSSRRVEVPTATGTVVSTTTQTRSAALVNRDFLYTLSNRTHTVSAPPLGSTTTSYMPGTKQWSISGPQGQTTIQLDKRGFVKSASPAGGPIVDLGYAQGRLASLTEKARQKSCSHNQGMLCTTDSECRTNASYSGYVTATCVARTSTVGWDYHASSGYLSRVKHPVAGAFTDVLETDYEGRILRSEDPNDNVTRVGFDREGLPLSVTPPGKPAHEMSYNDVDMTTSYSAPAPQPSQPRDQVAYAYTPDRKPALIAGSDGRQALFDYHAVKGTLESVTVIDPVFGLGGVIDYEDVSATEQRVTMPDSSSVASGTSLRVTSAGGLPRSVTWTRGGLDLGRVTYGFGSQRLVSSLAVLNGESTTFTYEGPRLVKADVSAGSDELLAYNGTSTTTPAQDRGHLRATATDWIQTEQKYDANGALARYRLGRTTSSTVPTSVPSTVDLNAELYGYEITQRDAAGRITERLETVDGVRSTYQYGYDLGGRLTDVTTDGVLTAHYAYDANGNRTRRDGESYTEFAGTDGTNGYDDQDRVLMYDGTGYLFSRAGQLMAKDDGNGGVSYKYDMLGNLREVDNGSDVITYRVDGMGRRIAKFKNGVEMTRWTYATALNPVSELDVPTGTMRTYVYASRGNVPDLMVVRQGANVMTFRLATDHLGSVRMVVNANCPQTVPSADVYETCVVWHASYDEYGRRELVKGDGGLHSFGFAGGLWDADTGLVRFGARDYDAQVGRWTARDPILFAGGQANLFAYVNNDPVNNTDPSGLILPLLAGACAAGGCEALGAAVAWTAGLLSAGLAGGAAAHYQSDISAAWDALTGAVFSDNAREKDLLKHLGDSLGIPWKKLSDELHKIKKAAGLKGREVDIAPDGTVTDPVSGEEIGNICDK